MRFSFSARTVAATVALAATTPIQAGATFTWPSATCNGTLQACVDASGGGGVVEIATNTPINESLVFALEGLSLRPANGFQPRFAPGRGIAALRPHSAIPTVWYWMFSAWVSRMAACQPPARTAAVPQCG